MKIFEQFCSWCKINWKLMVIGAAVFINLTVFVAIIMVSRTNNSPDISISEPPPPPVAEPVPTPAPPPEVEPVEEPSDIKTPANDSENASAYDAGLETGAALNESLDLLIDFWHGFNEATGASEWARERLDSGLDAFAEWFDENFPPEHDIDSDTKGD